MNETKFMLDNAKGREMNEIEQGLNRLEIFQRVYGAEHVFKAKELERLRQVAELIVQECIRLCDQVDFVGADECIDAIREHFGVEK